MSTHARTHARAIVKCSQLLARSGVCFESTMDCEAGMALPGPALPLRDLPMSGGALGLGRWTDSDRAAGLAQRGARQLRG